MAVHSAAPHSTGQVLPFRESLLAVLGLAFVIMLVAFDQTVVGTALPTIVAELKGFELYAWVGTGYLLTSVITVPIFGRLGDFYGRKPFVLASIILFTAASVLCGMADSMLFLVLARALQGIGGGMLVGTAFAAVPDLFPDSRVRLRWQVVMSTGFGIANAVGPSLGGFLTQYSGWRSVFYVNIPIGLISLFFVYRYLPHLRQHKSSTPIKLDWPGALLIAAALGCLQLFVELLPRHGLTSMPLALIVISAVSFYALWRWERYFSQPLLPMAMFSNVGLAALFRLALLAGFIMFSLMFYAPLLFQGGFGMSPKDAGLLITPLVVCITFGSIANSRIIVRLKNPNLMLFAGFILMGVCCLGITAASRFMSQWMLIAIMFAGGFGIGFVLPNLTVFAQQLSGREHLGIATALLQSMRMVGGMLGTAVTGTLITHLYANGVRDTLVAEHATQWHNQFIDPDILANVDGQKVLLAQLAAAGHDGRVLLDAARESLVSSIHMGIALAALIAFVAIWLTRGVPLIKITHVEPVVSAE